MNAPVRCVVTDGMLDECIRKFMAMPVSQHHLYEIYTTQSDLVSPVLSAAHIVEPGCAIFSKPVVYGSFETGGACFDKSR
jgi:hypothetical protein